MSGVYSIVKDYTNRTARGLGAAMDWEALGFFHKTPKGYHFTKRGFPDKRYSNYPEVLAYYETERYERSRLIEKATQ